MSATPVGVEVLLFDLGGVLVDYIGVERLHALLDGQVTLADVGERWPQSPALRRLELGHCTAPDFAAEFVAEWNLGLTPAAFLAEFSTWSRAPLAGALALLDGLRDQVRLACLSNMNSAYWQRVRDDMGFGRRFEHCYASHETGVLKPDPRAYRHAMADLGCEAAQVAFFDDTPANVDAASALGLCAFHVRGVDALREALGALCNSNRAPLALAGRGFE